MKPRFHPRLARPFALGLAALACAPATASLVVELNLAQLHERSAHAFHGRCIARREVPGAKPFAYTEYTFEVTRAIRGCRDAQGKPLEQLTVRHAGTSQPRARADGLEEAPRRWGIPEHSVGQESVLFLTRESSVGLCAPVGLEQGKLAIVEKEGHKHVVNKRGKRLFQEVTAARFQALTAAEAAALGDDGETLDLECFLGLCSKLRAE